MGSVKPALPSILGALRGVPGAGLNWRQVALSAAVGVWATRCMFPHSLPLLQGPSPNESLPILSDRSIDDVHL